MTRCRYWRKRVPEAIYGDMDAETRRKMELHLSACEDCAGLRRRTAAAVRKMEARPAPDAERAPEFWEGYWDRLEARMAAAEAVREPRLRRRTLSVPTWAYGAVGAVLLVSLGIFIGRTLNRPPEEIVPMAGTMPSGTARTGPPALETRPEPALAARASRYLRRSRVLLLAVVNSAPMEEDPFRLHLPLQKKASEELLQEAAVLKKGFRGSDRRLERLVSDLELILLQIANLASDPEASDIEIIRAGVESRDLLFKINLSEIRRPGGKSSSRQAPAASGGDRAPARARTAAEA